VHKNQQKNVDFMSDILLDQGMDRRKMKKVIQYEALVHFEEYLVNLTSQNRDVDYVYMDLLDDEKPTQAQKRRFQSVLSSMIRDAESKLN
jgi:hypothetical protein